MFQPETVVPKKLRLTGDTNVFCSRLIELDEGIDALEAAIEFKNDGIANKQKELDSGQLLTDKDREGLVNKLSNLSPGEATSLLSKYFEKVVELRGNEKKLELKCSDLEVRSELLLSELVNWCVKGYWGTK